MKATPFSERPYYPMLLSNGNDAALVNYHGSMYTGHPGHAHHEGHQGIPCGWYKANHRMKFDPIMPVIQTGYHLMINGLYTEPQFYEQEFNPKTAVLTTLVKSSGIECKITSFMARDHLMVEHFDLLVIPHDAKVGLVLHVQRPRSFSMLSFSYAPNFYFKADAEKLIFDYHIQKYDINGSGFMFSDKSSAKTEGNMYSSALHFENLTPGSSVTKFLCVADNYDAKNYCEIISKNLEICREGYDKVKKDHEEEWGKYSGKSSVEIPDATIQYLYDLGIYTSKAHMYPQTGAISCGMLPNLWGGGVCVPSDTHYSYCTLLLANHLEESLKHLKYYKDFDMRGREFASKHDCVGTTVPVWANCFGEHLGNNYDDYVFKYKLLELGFAVTSFYWLWKCYPENKTINEYLPIIQGIFEFIYECFIRENGEEAFVIECKAANESNKFVNRDTLTTLIFAQAFYGYEHMCQHLAIEIRKEYVGLSKRLEKSIASNFRDGYLYADINSKNIALIYYYLYNFPSDMPFAEAYIKQFERKNIKNTWGICGDNPCESYRDWPWENLKAALSFTCIGDSKTAFYWLKNSCKYAAATGALPEKIRIDGYPINYWYSSTHGMFSWAVIYALCYKEQGGALNLLFGLDGEWRNIKFVNLRAFDGLEVSANVKDRTIISLEITNHAARKQEIKIRCNPLYTYDGALAIILEPGESFGLNK